MRELLQTIEEALKARGWSARQASMAAVGSPQLISNMRRGRVPSVDRVQALCDTLGIEFYVGPPREAIEVDERRLALALEAAERGLSMSRRTMDAKEKAELAAAVYVLIGNERGPANAARVGRLISMVAGSGPERVVRMAQEGKEEPGGGDPKEP